MKRAPKKRKTRKLGTFRLSKSLRDFLPPVSRISVILPTNWQITAVEKKSSGSQNNANRHSKE
jgi:hypothetical protein